MRVSLITTWLVQIQALTRWNEWATSKLPFLISCLLITQIHAEIKGEQSNPLGMLLLFLQLCLLAAYGYMVNSFCDVSTDAIAGKTNPFSQLRPVDARALLIGWLGAATGLAWIQFARDGATLGLLAACYGCATAYSAPPLRLKERGIMGFIAASGAQRLLPVILIFEALGTWSPAAWLLCLLNGLIGFRYILAHQIKDYYGDIKSGTETMATINGIQHMTRLGRFLLFPLEILTLLTTVLFLQRAIPAMAWFMPAYLCILAVYVLRLPTSRMRIIDGSTYEPFSGLYNIFMPLYLAFVLALGGYFGHATSFTILVFITIWLLPEVWDKRLILAGKG